MHTLCNACGLQWAKVHRDEDFQTALATLGIPPKMRWKYEIKKAHFFLKLADPILVREEASNC